MSKVIDVVVYFAGPYLGATPSVVDMNCKSAQKTAEVMVNIMKDAGFNIIPVIPHNLSAGLQHFGEDFWLYADVELMKRCDVVYMCNGWQLSKGCHNELSVCQETAMPVLYNFEQAFDYLCKFKEKLEELESK